MRIMRASQATRKAADGPRVPGWAGVVFAAASILIFALPASTQEAANVGALSGTLKKVKDTSTITSAIAKARCPSPT